MLLGVNDKLSSSICYPVSLIPCHALPLCYSQNLFICYPVFLIPCHVLTLCYSQNLFICYPVSLIPCHALTLCYSQNLSICYPVFLIPCHVLTLCYSQNLSICYPVSLILSVHRPYSPVSLPTLKILTENIEHLTGLLLTLHVITKNMTIRLICMSFRV